MRLLKLSVSTLIFLCISLTSIAQPVREKVNFDENWKFYKGDVHGAQFISFDDDDWRSLELPHDWSIEGKFSKEYASGQGYLPGGIGWYRKTFTVGEDKKGKKIEVFFDGVYQNAEVWINGEYLGKRPFGFISFSRDLTPHLKYGKENVIAVRVDHTNYADSRWYTGSGITRHVWLKVKNPIHVGQWGTFIRTPEVSVDQSLVKVTTTIVNDSDESRAITLNGTVSDSGKEISSAQTSVKVPAHSKRKVDQQLQVTNPSLWSTEDPHLYNFVTEIRSNGTLTDRKKTSFGIRRFRFDSQKGFFLNGESMLIKGVCLHNDAGALGSAVPVQEWRDRLKIMKKMGANAIRTSHNPPAPELLDLADEMGFLVMDEAFDEWEIGKKKWIKGRNVGQDLGGAGLTEYYSQHGYSDFFEEWAKKDIQDMVKRDRNHPSVILWSIGNEVDYPNDPYTDPSRDDYQPWRPSGYHVAEIARDLYDYVKEVDPTRPVTAAVANTPLANKTGYTAVLDVVGYNYQEHHYEKDHKEFPNRKIIGSENGDSYEDWLAVKNNEYISSQFLWTGIDYIGEADRFPNRSSDYGLVSLSNFPKPGFYYRQSLWSEDPMVFIGVKTGKHNVESHWNWEHQQKKNLEVVGYSNAETVELYLNGKSLGTKKPDNTENHVVRWQVPYESGTIRAVASKDGKKVASYDLKTAGEPYQIMLQPNRSEIKANGDDIASVNVFVTDQNGRVVPHADHKINFEVQGPGENIGVGNGNHESLAPYKADYRKVYKGKARIIIQSNEEPGDIQLKATAKDLKSASVTIEVSD